METSDQIRTHDDTTIPRVISQPYTVKALDELMHRNFQVDVFNWTTPLTTRQIVFPGAIWTIPTVANVLKRFRYVRFGIKLEFRMVSTNYHQGSLMLGWLPCVTNTAPNTAQYVSGYHSVILSASGQQNAGMEIPYLHPKDWIDTTQTATTANRKIATVYILELNPLLTTSASVPALIPCLVNASFDHLELSGYQSQSSSKKKKAQQFGRPCDAFVQQSKKFTEDKEGAARNQKNQRDASVGFAVQNISKIARSVPLIGTVWSPIADVLNMIFGTDFAKTVSQATTTPVIQRYYDDANQASGLDNAVELSLYPNAKVTAMKKMFGMDTSHQCITEIARTPLLFDQVTFDGTTTAWTVNVAPLVVGSSITTRDYCYMMSSFCRFWRGSMKFLFHFCVPVFYSLRIRLTLWYNSTANNIGDIPSTIIDIKGDTWHGVTVPYLFPSTWQPLVSGMETPVFLKLEQLSAIVGAPSPTTSICYVNIFRSAGEDFELAVLNDPLSTTANTTSAKTWQIGEYEQQTSITEKFSLPFASLIDGVKLSLEKGETMPEIIGTGTDVCRRMARSSVNTLFGLFSLGSQHHTTAMRIVQACFLFIRGSVILRNLHLNNDSTHNDGWYLNVGNGADNYVEYGWAPAYQNPTQPYQPEAVSLPYYCTQPYVPCYDASATGYMDASASPISGPVSAKLVNSLANSVGISAGDDLTMLFLVPWANLLNLSPEKNVAKISTKTIDRARATRTDQT